MKFIATCCQNSFLTLNLSVVLLITVTPFFGLSFFVSPLG